MKNRAAKFCVPCNQAITTSFTRFPQITNKHARRVSEGRTALTRGVHRSPVLHTDSSQHMPVQQHGPSPVQLFLYLKTADR